MTDERPDNRDAGPGADLDGAGSEERDTDLDAAGIDEPAVLSRRRKESIGQTIGGVLFGFEQQVLRTMPPPHELVHHARPDAPIPAGDGTLIHIGMPDVVIPDDEIEPEANPGAEAGAKPEAEAGLEPEGDA